MANTKKTDKTPKSKGKSPSPGPKRLPLVEKTYFAKRGEFGKNWKVVDASGQTLGRLASQIATVLMGKHLPSYTPNNDTGESVIVVNASQVKMTGKKWEQKVYQHHSNFPGGIKTVTAARMLKEFPERIIEKAVWRMMPKSRGHMARHWFSKLHVYAGPDHPHAAQKPEVLNLVHSRQGRE